MKILLLLAFFLGFPSCRTSEQWRKIGGKRVFEGRTCNVHLIADQTMYKHIGGKQGSDHAKTRSAIRTTMRDLVKGVNNIYENNDFHGIKGINFAIQRTTVCSW
ncbi:hypothetical protein niasHT_026928 [Heterodera trifolii]|uniref:Uncharacterized protein n=1 Tax=Heterodera trifolii TaxID=157864 RepID=A0ABD2KRC8_9BILA